MTFEKIETGVMVMKDGKAWGKTYDDGHATSYGWMSPCDAPIHDPRYCRKTTDLTYTGSQYTKELEAGKIVHVTRKTIVEVDAQRE